MWLFVGRGCLLTQFDKRQKEVFVSEDKIIELLFKRVEKPKGLFDIKIVNVFDNRYRINLWIRVEDKGVSKTKVGTSYFAILEEDSLKIKTFLNGKH